MATGRHKVQSWNRIQWCWHVYSLTVKIIKGTVYGHSMGVHTSHENHDTVSNTLHIIIQYTSAHTHACTHACTHTHYIPKSHCFSDTSSKDLFTVTAFRRAAVTEGGMILSNLVPLTVSFCRVVHFERQTSTADRRVKTCKKMELQACHVAQSKSYRS